MDRESLTKLQLDRRLLQRKGWIAPESLEGALKDLPDVASKATTLGEVEAEAEAEAPAAETAAEPGA